MKDEKASKLNTAFEADKGRRKFLKYFLAGSALVVLENSSFKMPFSLTSRAEAAAISNEFEPVFYPGNGFPQSVASGDPTPTGALLWTRIDPQISNGISSESIDFSLVQWLDSGSEKMTRAVKDMIEQGKFVMFEISTTQNFTNTVLKGFAPIWNSFDNIVRIDVDTKLAPHTIYYYRFITKSGYVSQTGRFRTLQQESDTKPVKFGYLTCQDYTNGYFNAIDHLAEEEMDFVLHVGDYIYESVGDPLYQSPIPGREIRLPSGGPKAMTMEDYRTLYRTYRADPSLQKLHENHAIIGIWDDHEFANDTYYPAIAPDDSLSPDPERRLTANQVWFEYMPARVKFDKSLGFENSIKIYRNIKIGQLAELILTDQRLYRSPHACGPSTTDKYFNGGCADIDNPRRSMLGNPQKTWFLDQMAGSDALWKIWGNEVQFSQLTLLGRYLNLDAWDGYRAERRQIATHIKQNGIKNVIALTGDFHTFEAGLMKVDYENDADSEAIGVELMVGSVTSSNLREAIRNSLNNTSTVSSPVPLPVIDEIVGILKGRLNVLTTITSELIFKELQNIIKVENPWIKLIDSSTHGYAVLELSALKAKWTTYSVDQIESPGAKKSLLWQIEIPKDKPAINVVEEDHLVNLF